MPLTALPVTASELVTLQSGIQFFTNQNQADQQATAINAPGSTQSVFTYTAQLLQNNISLSQVAMAVSALMEGGTIAVGNTTTPNTLTLLSTQFLPAQVTTALANNYNPTVYAAEALGLALASQTSFNTNFVGLDANQFSQAVASATGVNANAIQQFVVNWTNFYTANPAALQGLTVKQASYGAAFGDAVGVALLNPTSANLQTVTSTNPAFPFSPNTIKGLVANALILIAEGKYEVGKALGALPQHDLLQGEAPGTVTTFTFTPGTDTFVGTNGNDTYNGNISGVGGGAATLSPLQFDSAKDQGGGSDTINLNVLGASVLAAVAPLVTGVENWKFNTGLGALTAPIDASTLDSAKFIEQIGGVSKTNWVDVTKVGTGTTVAFTNQTLAAGTQGDVTVNKGVHDATIQLTNVDSAAFVRFNETTAGDLTKITVNGSVAAPGTLVITNAVAAATNAVTELDLGITSKGTVALAGNFAPLQTVDASKSTGDMTLGLIGFGNINSVKMGSGNETLFDFLGAKVAAVTTVTYDLGAGNDTFTMFMNAPAVGPHNVAMNATLGAGGDTVSTGGASFVNIALAPTAANFQQGFFTIADFSITQDTVNVTGAGAFQTLTNAQLTAIAGSADLFAATQLAFTTAGANKVFAFGFGTDTYIADNNAVAAFNQGDGIIKLTGVAVADLNAANFAHS